jgi:hypothetical protein
LASFKRKKLFELITTKQTAQQLRKHKAYWHHHKKMENIDFLGDADDMPMPMPHNGTDPGM